MSLRRTKSVLMSRYLLVLWTFSSMVAHSQNAQRLRFYFDNGKHVLSMQQMLDLRERMDAISKNDNVLVLGYASQSGEDSANMKLSQLRAEAISDFLIGNGFSRDRIAIRYFGETKADDRAEKEWRRADFIISNEESENWNPFQPMDSPSVFIIDGNVDTTIVCKKGTKIVIKAGSLVNGSTGDIAEKITIKVSEYLSAFDLLEKGLTTRSNGRPLESGGMLQIEATENNVNLTMRKGRNLRISVPCQECGRGMSTFYGSEEKNTINWIQAPEKPGKVIPRKTMPIFAEGQESLKHFILQNKKYPTKAFSKGVQGTVIVKFLINKSGEVSEIKLDKGIEPSLDKEALRIVEMMPRWTPAKLDDAPIDYIYTIPIEFKITREPFGKYNITSIGGDIHDYKVDDQMDTAVVEREKRERIAKQSEMQAIVDFGYYVITTSQLGWVNVDKFDRNQMTNFIVDANTIDFVKVYLIMKNQKSLFRDEYRTNSKFNFRQIGLNQDVYILSIKSIVHKMYMSLLEANTSQKAVLVSNYKEATLAEIKNTVDFLKIK